MAIATHRGFPRRHDPIAKSVNTHFLFLIQRPRNRFCDSVVRGDRGGLGLVFESRLVCGCTADMTLKDSFEISPKTFTDSTNQGIINGLNRVAR